MTYGMKMKAMLGTTNPNPVDCIERNEEAWVFPVFTFHCDYEIDFGIIVGLCVDEDLDIALSCVVLKYLLKMYFSTLCRSWALQDDVNLFFLL
ncbi:hypothetical protein K7X08_010694 [Anisodus acutangulus]|uniref:Uncharacterized protein n=1 Tax=Anisodus acutangulus TaxID=402998 RepID=A0A9Q1LYL7_9SOLA|nr:hypothetical protein K7X08_010694 [Anisodus acutangulus]